MRTALLGMLVLLATAGTLLIILPAASANDGAPLVQVQLDSGSISSCIGWALQQGATDECYGVSTRCIGHNVHDETTGANTCTGIPY